MPSVAVITAAAPSTIPYLAAAGRSVRALEPVDDWVVEWHVTVDALGPDRRVLTRIVDTVGADRVSVNHTILGPGQSRNRALAHVDTDWVVTLDGDDLLTPDALTAWATTAHPDRGWGTFRADDVYDDGTITHHLGPWPEGPVPAGEWLSEFRVAGEHPRHPIAVLYPTEDLIRAGGWTPDRIAQDAGPVLTVTSARDGWCSQEVTHLYRRHRTQTSLLRDQPGWAEARADTHRLAVRRAELVAGLDAAARRHPAGGRVGV